MNDTGLELARLADAIEASASREIFAAAPAPLASALGLESREVEGATLLLAPRIPDAYFNRVIGLGVHEPASEAGLDAIAAAYTSARVKDWWIHLTPGAAPAALAGWLEQRGFRAPARKSWAKVSRGRTPAPPVETAAEVRPVRSEEEKAAAEAIVAAYGVPAPFAAWFEALARRPRWQAYVALDGSNVLGGAFLYLDGDKAWLGAAGVRKEARGRHVHRALMARRIEDAIARGCTRIFTETGEAIGDEPNPSLANMEWCGFERVCSRLNYAAPA
ncbi:MAG TPA: GNAT family N-acetyltransferase [Gammaproteobacteria bacterium]|nr:GNAT family N-acetyltransferase [Gammaproteobacteria bacterium]